VKMPNVIIISGANGAGKSTLAPYLLRDTFSIAEFVNADTIAQGLSAFAPEDSAIEAGKIMLMRLKELAARQYEVSEKPLLIASGKKDDKINIVNAELWNEIQKLKI